MPRRKPGRPKTLRGAVYGRRTHPRLSEAEWVWLNRTAKALKVSIPDIVRYCVAFLMAENPNGLTRYTGADQDP